MFFLKTPLHFQMFGEMPPRELIINDDDSWSVRQEKSVHALTFLLNGNNEQTVHDLVQVMAEFEAAEGEADSEEQAAKLKNGRQKKMNKLKDFFGGNISEEAIAEQKFLSDIQQAIAEEVASDDQLKSLAGEVQELKTKIVRRVSTKVKRYVHLLGHFS